MSPLMKTLLAIVVAAAFAACFTLVVTLVVDARKSPVPPTPRQQLTHEAGVLVEMWQRGTDVKRNEIRAKWPDLGVHLDDMLETYDEMVKT